MSVQLPKKWLEITLGDVIGVRNGYAFSSKAFKTSGVPLIRQSNLGGATINLEKCVYLDKHYLEEKSNFILRKGDILVGMSGSIGKLCIYNLDEPGLQNQRTGKVVVNSENSLSEKYIWHFLTTIEEKLLEKGKGVAVANISGSDIESLVFPLPPLEEQKRIVAKLDALMARSTRAREELAHIPRLIERYKQAVLAAAFSGELTADWRKTNKNCLLPPKPERLKKRSLAVKPLNNLDASILPDSWEMTILASVVECLDSIRKPINKEERQARSGEIPYYGANGQVGWIDDYLFDDDLVIVVEDETFLGRTKPFSYKITGRSWVNNHAHVLRPTEAVMVDYLNYSLMFYPFIPLTTGTTGRRKLTQGSLMGISYPLAPIEEQALIVERIEACFAAIDSVAKDVGKTETLCNRLEQATLAKAFRGELVSQDPNDEPASVLLERIRAERVEQPSKGRKKAKATV